MENATTYGPKWLFVAFKSVCLYVFMSLIKEREGRERGGEREGEGREGEREGGGQNGKGKGGEEIGRGEGGG